MDWPIWYDESGDEKAIYLTERWFRLYVELRRMYDYKDAVSVDGLKLEVTLAGAVNAVINEIDDWVVRFGAYGCWAAVSIFDIFFIWLSRNVQVGEFAREILSGYGRGGYGEGAYGKAVIKKVIVQEP